MEVESCENDGDSGCSIHATTDDLALKCQISGETRSTAVNADSLCNGDVQIHGLINDASSSNGHLKATANGLSDETEDDELLSEIDQMVASDNDELSSLRQELIRLESTNERLENELKQVCQQKDEEIQGYKQSVSESETQSQALQKTIADQLNELTMWKERVEINDRAARKAIEGYKADHQASLDKVSKKFSDCKAEKESMVVKYAQGEAKIVQLQANVDKLELRVKDTEREKSVLAEKLRNLKTESVKHSSNLGEKASELVTLRKELESQKESISSHEYRTKWAQNKLKSEVDAHKETKARLEEMTRRYKESKEECVTIRTNCQDMIKTYQESEEIKSNSLDIEVKKKETELQEKSSKISELMRELETLRSKFADVSKEVELLRKQSGAGEVKLEEMEKTNTDKIKELQDLNACIVSLREENSQIRNKLREMQSLQHDLESKTTECTDLQNQLKALNQTQDEYQVEMDSCKERDGEMLQLTQKMTERNAELQSENSALKSKITGIGITSSQQENEISRLEQLLKHQEHQSSREKSTVQSELDKANLQLGELNTTIESLKSDIETYQTEVKTLKKKQTSSVKELTREVHTLKRQLEAYESKHMDDARQSSPAGGGSAPVSLQHSRTNSTSSLDKPEGWVVVDHQRQPSPEHSRQSSQLEPLPSSDLLEPQFLEPDKQKMVEKIVKLQKINARKNEKLDFCQDHIRQLIEEVQRKTKIIQMYAMKEQAGALSSDSMDRHRSTIAKKGGIMASISNQQSKDETMSLQLSLKISNQLQALLEDTLLKNITLKENMDTLGREIEKISQENITMKDQLRKLQKQGS